MANFSVATSRVRIHEDVVRRGQIPERSKYLANGVSPYVYDNASDEPALSIGRVGSVQTMISSCLEKIADSVVGWNFPMIRTILKGPSSTPGAVAGGEPGKNIYVRYRSRKLGPTEWK
jgi:hypothetical protein